MFPVLVMHKTCSINYGHLADLQKNSSYNWSKQKTFHSIKYLLTTSIYFLSFQSVRVNSCNRSTETKAHLAVSHDEVIKWKHFPRYWPFVRGIHRSPVNFPHKYQWRGALMLSLICAWINSWVNNRGAGDLSHRAHYDVIVMCNRSTLTK